MKTLLPFAIAAALLLPAASFAADARTEYYERMRESGRILDEDWGHYDYASILVEPRDMTTGELRAGFDQAYREFYSLPSIAERMLPPPRRNWKEHAAYLIANLKTHLFLRRHPSAWGTIS